MIMVLARRDTHEVLKLVDWHLLVFFAALFIVVEGLNDTGLPEHIYERLRGMFGASATAQASPEPRETSRSAEVPPARTAITGVFIGHPSNSGRRA